MNISLKLVNIVYLYLLNSINNSETSAKLKEAIANVKNLKLLKYNDRELY